MPGPTKSYFFIAGAQACQVVIPAFSIFQLRWLICTSTPSSYTSDAFISKYTISGTIHTCNPSLCVFCISKGNMQCCPSDLGAILTTCSTAWSRVGTDGGKANQNMSLATKSNFSLNFEHSCGRKKEYRALAFASLGWNFVLFFLSLNVWNKTIPRNG